MQHGIRRKQVCDQVIQGDMLVIKEILNELHKLGQHISVDL